MSRVGEISGLMPYTPTEYSISLLMNLIIGPFGLFLSLAVVYVTISTYGKSIPISAQFILSLCVGDVLVNTTGMVFGIMDLYAGGWSSGQLGCQINSEIPIYGETISVLSFLSMAVERYVVVIRQETMSQRTATLISVFIWPVMGVFVNFPTYFGFNRFLGGLQSGKLVCAVAWWDDHIESRATIILVVSFVILIVGIINAIYMEIFKTFSRAQRERNSLMQGVSKFRNDEEDEAPSTLEKGVKKERPGLSKTERLLLFKCVLITGCFMGCWLPMLIKILYEMSTLRPVSSEVDLLATVVAALNTVFDGLLLLFLDQRIKSKLYQMLPDWLKRASRPRSVQSPAASSSSG